MPAPKRRKADGEAHANNNSGAAHLFGEIANRTSHAAGRALTFLMAAGIVLCGRYRGRFFIIPTRGSSSSTPVRRLSLS